MAFVALDEAPADVLAEAFAQRARLVDADTINRELSVMKAAIAWWRARGWLTRNPTIGIERRPAPPDRTRALSREQIAALLDLKISVRERTLWKALYETCARVEEILCLDVEDLLLTDKRGRVTSKGGTIEWVHGNRAPPNSCPACSKAVLAGPCSSPTAGRLPTSPRVTHAQLPGAPACLTGELLNSSRPSLGRSPIWASPTPAELEARGGWTLHQLRHSALTHEAEDGTNTPTLWARSRHASVRSLERYARPSVHAVAAHVAGRDPLRRRK